MFYDSSLKMLQAYRFVEESTAMPVFNYPVYVGSGKCVMSIDASGMQGFNNRVQRAYNGIPFGADMYVAGHGILGKAINRYFVEEWWEKDINTVPFGWLDYAIELDGKVYETQDIERCGAMFRRDNDIYRAEVKTTYILDSSLQVEITACIPYGSLSPVLSFRVRSYNDQRYTTDEKHSVKVGARLHLTVRDGKPLFDRVQLRDDFLLVHKKGYKEYRLKYFLSNSDGTKVQLREQTAEMTVAFQSGQQWSEAKRFMFSFDGKDDVSDAEQMIKKSRAGWKKYYCSRARAETGIPEEEFLFNNSLYIFRLGYQAELGYPGGHPFNFPACWHACCFWDSAFIMDALIRCSCREEADKLVQYLYRCLRKEGKPYPWMMIYDGTTFLEPSRDIAPLVIAAHATSAMRHYEYFRNDAYLEKYIYPIMHRCSSYAVQEMFSQNEQGGWYVSMPVSNDVCDAEGEEINQTFTTLWFAVLLRKTYEYGKKLGAAEEIFKQISDNIYLEHTEDEYLHSKGVRAEDWRWASWIPFLLFPSEGMPFLDLELYRKTLQKYTYTDLYLKKQNCYQPWTECIEAQSDHRLGLTQESYRLLRAAVSHTFGNGYFAEVGPHQQTCGYAPYISAHSSYLGAYCDQFVNFSIWEKRGSLFTEIPYEYRERTIRLHNIYCAGNIVLQEAVREEKYFSAKFQGEFADFELTVLVPHGMRGCDVRVFVNGEETAFALDERENTVKLRLTGQAEIEIR